MNKQTKEIPASDVSCFISSVNLLPFTFVLGILGKIPQTLLYHTSKLNLQVCAYVLSFCEEQRKLKSSTARAVSHFAGQQLWFTFR